MKQKVPNVKILAKSKLDVSIATTREAPHQHKTIMKKEVTTILFLLLGYTFCFAQPSNDNKAEAIEIAHTALFTSTDAAYTNVNATQDGPGVGCINPARNVWFKFQATSTDIEVRILTGGTKGTLQNPAVVLSTEQGDLLGCHPQSSTAFLQRTNLVVGNWYYLAVDAVYGEQGSFTLETRNSIGHDLRDRALTVQHTTSWTSADAAYTNVDATQDGPGAGCISPKRNVWFKFQASSTNIDVRVLTGGSKGTLQNPAVVLFTEQGDLLGCHVGTYAFLQRTNLVMGAWYYLAVDSQYGEQGTFTLTVKNAVNHDLREKALVLQHTTSWISADAAYTNVNATPDGPGTTCTSPKRNVWFKFQATSADIEVRVLTGGVKGTLQSPAVVLYTEQGLSVGCHSHSTNAFLRLGNLVVGAWYNLAIDGLEGEQGTFTLSIKNDLGNDYKAKAQILPHESEWCSADAFFTNAEATSDETNSSTCGTTFTKNVWFKFQATSTAATAKLLTGGEKGTLANGSLYLTDANGNFLSCQTGAGGATVSITNYNLVKGQWYFIIVDNSNGTNGTFSLCLEGGVQTSTFCESIHCDSEGGVGIGTTTIPNGYRLAVQGKIIAEGVKVDLHTNWPDYVFDKDYPLMSLADMKQYIEREGHLPEVPSAKEVQANGIDLGEMNAILLRKIEENTLLLIELEERLRKLEAETKMRKQKNKKHKK